MSRTFERQVNELHIRVAILNRLTELGRPQTVAMASPRPGQGRLSFKLIFTTAPFHCGKPIDEQTQANEAGPCVLDIGKSLFPIAD